MFTLVLVKVTEFFNKHKNAIMLTGAAVVIFLVGYSSGRMTKPAKIVTQTVTQTQVVTQVQYKDRVVMQKVYVEVEKTHDHKDTTVTTNKDGTTTSHTVEDDNTDETTNDNETKTNTQTNNVTQVAQSQTTQTKTVQYDNPNWLVGVGAGVSVPTLLGHPALGVPNMRGSVIEATVGRRLFGGLYLNVFGSTQGTVGAGLQLVF